MSNEPESLLISTDNKTFFKMELADKTIFKTTLTKKPMIQANELRIWNLVNKEGEPEPYEIRFYDFNDTSSFEPIPLTPEILEKAGFENKKETRCYHKKINTCKDFIIEMQPVGYVLMNIDLTVVCKYLHQLQNLYFALTGNELSINL